jgi:hypothetical protein
MQFAGTRDSAAGAVVLDVYDVSNVAAGDPKIRIVDRVHGERHARCVAVDRNQQARFTNLNQSRQLE